MGETVFNGPFVCGEHFCDSCGDCMACYSTTRCDTDKSEDGHEGHVCIVDEMEVDDD